ncbi:CHAP domain-containing protein [Thermomonospora catenispora]|uniref:CHAP domain-containing protein n=1 Tax=Thermomonospora catenispora TaxID=2493090 RepID=UPI001124C886|nr:CHAP domain-containing protein [Thermomonospora catenispora]TNY38020.1 CHAP domain-containing protein [Thermomonospora catenispora]
MDPIGEKLLDVAKAELGYKEKPGGYTKYGDWYGKNVDNSPYFATAPWCDMFLAWAADKAGVTDWVGQFAYTVAHARWFARRDAWGAEPEPGAIVFFDWSGTKSIDNIDHVGIVEKVAGDRIHTIEGNADGVHLKRKVRHASTVVGYGYPAKVQVPGRSLEEALGGSDGAAADRPRQAASGRTDGHAGMTAVHGVPVRDGGPIPLPEAPGFADLLTVALVGGLALVVGKRALGGLRLPALLTAGVPVRLPAISVPRLPAKSPVRIRKRGRHHRTPVALPADVTPADLAAASAETVAMPQVSAAVAAEAEDREFWGQVSRLDAADLEYWNEIIEETEHGVPAH